MNRKSLSASGILTSGSYFCRLVIALVLISSCTRISVTHWVDGISENIPVVIISGEERGLESMLTSEVALLADNASATSNSFLRTVLSGNYESQVQFQALAIVPSNADEWMPLWVLSGPSGLLSAAADKFVKPFSESSYRYEGARIYLIYPEEEGLLYGFQSGNIIYLSESSYAIEEVIRAIRGIVAGVRVQKSALTPGSVILNTPSLDRYAAVETAVRYRPFVFGSLAGTGATVLNITRGSTSGSARVASGSQLLSMKGTIPLVRNSEHSPLVRAITGRNHTNILDRYVSQDAALAVFMQMLHPVFTGSETELDQYLNANRTEFERFTNSLGENFALAAFASSGFHAMGEYAYLRMVEDQRAVRQLMSDWLDRGLVQYSAGHYILQSRALANLISGELASSELFYISFTGDALIMTQRPALLQKLVTDRDRRRTLYFNENYLNIRSGFADQLSGFAYLQSDEFLKFVQSLLNTTHSADLFFDQFDILAMSFETTTGRTESIFEARTWSVERTQQPFDDRWFVALDGTDLTGNPVLANIGGSSRDEVLISTKGGTVLALAADGTQVFRVSTNDDTPVGPPVVFDWYANGQMTVLQAAGNKIYGWSNGGIPLPGFPIVLSESLSAPLLVADVNRSGLAELIVATSDRMLHVLDQRGNNINGWPQSVNATIRSKPLLEDFVGRRSIVAYAENVIFAWEISGSVRSGFPIFNRAPLKGDLMIYDDRIISGAADGTVISVGRGTSMEIGNAPVMSTPGSEFTVQGIRLSDGGIIVRPQVSAHTVRAGDENTVNEPLIFATADNGSIFAINLRGQLRFTQSLGQPSLPSHPPVIADVNRNGRVEIMGVAGFGRLYAWQLLSGERFYGLPTTALQYPVFADLSGNGRMEMIAGTHEGLRAWTINR